MTQPIEETNEYQEEVARWRRLWGYTPAREQVMMILAERQFRQAVNGMIQRIADTYDVDPQSLKNNLATILNSQETTHE